jgi:hypothetical protein
MRHLEEHAIGMTVHDSRKRREGDVPNRIRRLVRKRSQFLFLGQELQTQWVISRPSSQ